MDAVNECFKTLGFTYNDEWRQYTLFSDELYRYHVNASPLVNLCENFIEGGRVDEYDKLGHALKDCDDPEERERLDNRRSSIMEDFHAALETVGCKEGWPEDYEE